jgi:hypothetical protein
MAGRWFFLGTPVSSNYVTDLWVWRYQNVNQMSSFAEKQILQCQKEHVHNDNDLQNTTQQLKIKQHEPH